MLSDVLHLKSATRKTIDHPHLFEKAFLRVNFIVMPKQMKKLLTVEGLAVLLKVSQKTISRRVKSNEIQPAGKAGKRVLYVNPKFEKQLAETA